MTSEQLRLMHQAKPFRPFEVHVADGRSIRVEHPELMAFAPPARTCRIFDASDSVEVLDLLLITSVKTLGAGTTLNGH